MCVGARHGTWVIKRTEYAEKSAYNFSMTRQKSSTQGLQPPHRYARFQAPAVMTQIFKLKVGTRFYAPGSGERVLMS